MLVKVCPLGEIVREVNIEEGSTVGAILTLAGVSINGRVIRLNNDEVSTSTIVRNGSTMTQPHVITLAAKMKGGR